MKTYTVTLKEVWYQFVSVDADSEEDAIKKVQDGDGAYCEMEYSHTLDSPEVEEN